MRILFRREYTKNKSIKTVQSIIYTSSKKTKTCITIILKMSAPFSVMYIYEKCIT